ncbi:type VII secretion protein EccB [Streptantibioticus ferralitis]|uniref:Type VII secretion protein EccB n=1 Tax=Streptantibioticus ferralitis TaxID=236510 RepID=A0ABT5Z4Q9_9ACTN|nr:type VII secretion protein EccB [Streptantibioticus ferralitis]MDF2258779.1 type VII secretion protein EccB [Streptantibioticus ferralitis]
MQTRRDHLHAYQFATGRLASALVSGDPGTGETPMRRAGLGTVFGVMIAALLLLAALVYGFLKPAGNSSWAHTGALIVENETGTRYLYANGQLHPTANYASALLASGHVGMVNVPRSALAGVPRGSAIGIPGAPDDVAEPGSLLTGEWADCLRPGADVGETLDFGPSTAHAVPDSTHILVADPNGSRYVLWHGTKYPVSGRPSLLALGLDTEQPVKATSAWLDALPTGTAIAPATIPGAGTGGRTVAGRAEEVGTLLSTVVSGTSHYYVLKSDGVAPLNATESALLAAAPGGRQPVRVSPTDLASLPSSADTSMLHRIPDLMTGTDGTGDRSALCLLQGVSGSQLRSAVVRETGRAAVATAAVLVPPERGVLAAPPKTSATARTPDPYLITDRGVKFQLTGDASNALGYGGVTPRVLPQSTLDQIPSGPQLSRAKAAEAVPGVN